jgi:hypothetical protein
MAHTNTARNGHTARTRPQIIWALTDFQRLATGWLEARRGRSLHGCREQILRSLLRAMSALNRAADGSNEKAQLRRARDAMLDCEMAFILLHEELGMDDFARAMTRIDQIVDAIQELATLEVAEWCSAELRPLPTNPVATSACILNRLREIAEAVAELLQSATKRADAASSAEVAAPA